MLPFLSAGTVSPVDSASFLASRPFPTFVCKQTLKPHPSSFTSQTRGYVLCLLGEGHSILAQVHGRGVVLDCAHTDSQSVSSASGSAFKMHRFSLLPVLLPRARPPAGLPGHCAPTHTHLFPAPLPRWPPSLSPMHSSQNRLNYKSDSASSLPNPSAAFRPVSSSKRPAISR